MRTYGGPFARMLLRERRYDLALSQAQEAINMSPRSRVLYHTKGLILAKMALQPSSDDIRRRRLAQSEDVLRTTINMAPADDYGYTTLANLYLDWARSVSGSSPDEAGLRSKYCRCSRGCDEPGDGGEQVFVVFGFADGGGGAVEAVLVA